MISLCVIQKGTQLKESLVKDVGEKISMEEIYEKIKNKRHKIMTITFVVVE